VDHLLSLLFIFSYSVGKFVASIILPKYEVESFDEARKPNDSRWDLLSYKRSGKRYLSVGAIEAIGLVTIVMLIAAVVVLFSVLRDVIL